MVRRTVSTSPARLSSECWEVMTSQPAARSGGITLLKHDPSAQMPCAERELAAWLPASPYATLTSVPGWGVVRVSNYAAALGDPHRWPGPRQIYQASGLSPMQYESAGKRRDGKIRPRRQRGAAPSPDRPRYRTVAHRSRRQSRCRRPEITRQARRHHRLRPRPPRHPHRLCAGPRPRHLRAVPLGLNNSRAFLGPGPGRRRRRSCPPAAPAAQRGRTTWTATSTGAA
jgi:Transposase IS116/IS110/IS902 family